MEKSIVVAKCNPRYAFMVTGVTHSHVGQAGATGSLFLISVFGPSHFFSFIRTHSFKISAAFRETGR